MPFVRRLAALFVALLLVVPAHAEDELSRLHKVLVYQEDGEVAVHIVGSRAPDFTSFALDHPFRVVVDWAGSALDGVPETQEFGKGLVRKIRAQQFESEAERISRVTIALAHVTDFRFEASSKEVIIRFKNVADLPPPPEPEPVVADKDKDEAKKKAPPTDPILAELAAQELPEGPLTEPAEPPAPPPPPPVVLAATPAAPTKEPVLSKANPKVPDPTPSPPPAQLAAQVPSPAPAAPAPKDAEDATVEAPAPASPAVAVAVATPSSSIKSFTPEPVASDAPKAKADPTIAVFQPTPAPSAAKPAAKPAAPAKPAANPVVARFDPPAPATPAAKPEPSKPAPAEAPAVAVAPVAPKATTPVRESQPTPVREASPAPKRASPAVALAPARTTAPARIVRAAPPRPARVYKRFGNGFEVIQTGASSDEIASEVVPFPVSGWGANKARPAPRARSRSADRFGDEEPSVFGQASEDEPAAKREVYESESADAGPRTMKMIGFQPKPKQSAVYVRCDGKARYKAERVSASKVVLHLFDTTVPLENNQRPLDTSFFDSPVTGVKATQVEGETRVDVDLRESVPFSVKRIGTYIYLYFDKP